MLNKLGGEWAPRPSTGPHKMRECMPLSLILRNRLKYALTRREVLMICMRRLIAVDGKIRTDINYPAGLMDVISIARCNEQFRMLFDVKGRFTLHKISPEEAKYKLLRVKKVAKGKKATQGRNPFHTGQLAAVPYCTTHDGRTIRYPDPMIKVNDTVKFDLTTGKIVDFIKFEVGNLALVTLGNNAGRVGAISDVEKHEGGFDIVHLKDKRGETFATRSSNVFCIGTNKAWISLPSARGIRLTVLEQRQAAEDAAEKEKKKMQRL